MTTTHTKALADALERAIADLDAIKWLRKPGGSPTKFEYEVEVFAHGAHHRAHSALAAYRATQQDQMSGPGAPMSGPAPDITTPSLMVGDGLRAQVAHLVDDLTEEVADDEEATYYRLRDGKDVLFSNMVGACARLLAAAPAAPQQAQANHPTCKSTAKRLDAQASEPQTKGMPDIADVVRVLRLKSNHLSRYSFFLTDPPGVKRVLDSCGNWVSVHELSELLDDSSTEWLSQELGIDPDAVKWAADDLASAREGDAMLREIAELLRGTSLTGSYTEIVRQLINAFQAPAVGADTARLDWLENVAHTVTDCIEVDSSQRWSITTATGVSVGRSLRAAIDTNMAAASHVPVQGSQS